MRSQVPRHFLSYSSHHSKTLELCHPVPSLTRLRVLQVYSQVAFLLICNPYPTYWISYIISCHEVLNRCSNSCGSSPLVSNLDLHVLFSIGRDLNMC